MTTHRDALLTATLRLADTALILGHRLSEWSARAPTLEDDIALSNMGLDLIGQARMFYDYAGAVEGKGRSEDDFAYLRDDQAYRNLLIVEQPNGDFAVTMVRQMFYAAFAHPFMQAMMQSSDSTLAAIAAKSEKELAYHLRHSSEWVIRLGDGTDESHRRAQAGVDDLAHYIDEFFDTDAGDKALIAAGILPDPVALKPTFETTIQRVLQQATLAMPARRGHQRGGRDGLHSEHLSLLLAEMQSLHRAHPGAVW
jgi:ring-1,2-phenylacetyl-CoA epoxidase subunit PaaC